MSIYNLDFFSGNKGRIKMTKKSNKEVNSVPYTKAGLLDKSEKKSSNKSNKESNKAKEADISENTPTTSKEKSTERENERPLH
jgi:hypothetical protein